MKIKYICAQYTMLIIPKNKEKCKYKREYSYAKELTNVFYYFIVETE